MDKTPGQRFRFEQYLDFLSKNGFDITFSCALSEKEYQFYHKKGNYFNKMVLFFRSLIRRFKDLKLASNYDIIFIFREGFFLGTSYFERKFAKKAKVIFDFDDAIWISKTSKNNKWFQVLKNSNKTRDIIKVSRLIFAGNDFLANYAKRFNDNVVIIPTTIDTDLYVELPKLNKEKVCIGWSGSFSTIDHFTTCLDALKAIKKKYGDKVYFKVIGDNQYRNVELKIQGIGWKKETEIAELQEIDIGIMPLPNDEWANGKCGLKGLQYMALCIPTIMSPVGVNSEIITHGENGFLASNTSEWVNSLSKLIESQELRKDFGKRGRETVVRSYSVNSVKHLYLKYFNDLIMLD